MCKNGPRRDDDWAMEGWQSRGNGLAAVLAWRGWGRCRSRLGGEDAARNAWEATGRRRGRWKRE